MNLKTRTLYLLLLAGNLGFSLATFGSESSDLQSSQLAAPAMLKDDFLLQLGTGYSTLTQQLMQNCLASDDKPGDDNKKSAEATSESKSDFNSIARSFGLDAKFSGTLFNIGEASAEFNFLFKSIDNDSSETYLYKIVHSYPNTGYFINKLPPENLLNTIGQHYYDKYQSAVAKQNKKQALDNFYRVCGDSYVTTLGHVASLYVAVQLQFASHEDNETFKANLEGPIPLNLPGIVIALETKWKAELANRHIKVDIKINALQEGGDIGQLGSLFVSGDSTDAGGSFSQICSLENLKACEAILTKINEYIGKEFPDQVTDDNWQKKSSVSTDFGTGRYSTYLDIPEYDAPVISDDIRRTRKKLYMQLLDTIQQRNLNEALIRVVKRIPYVYNTYELSLAQNISILNHNINVLKESGRKCFTENFDKNCQSPTNIDDLAVGLKLPDTWTITELDKPGGKEIAEHLFVLEPHPADDVSAPRIYRGIKKLFDPLGDKYDASRTVAEEIFDSNNPAVLLIREKQADTLDRKLLQLARVADYELFSTDKTDHYIGSKICITAHKRLPCGYVEAHLARQPVNPEQLKKPFI